MTSFPFDAVLFDLDGTLVATDRFWPDAARVATLRFFQANGIDRPAPSTAEWMNMVGKPLGDAFDETFVDMDPKTRQGLMDACVEEEHALLARGQAAFLGSVPETLTELKRRGVKLGIASNCSTDYLDVMMNGLGLRDWIDEGRCLYMPGIGNKADMIADLLLTFDTRSAVMVGDRPGDRDAAWANGVPHVHIPRGYGGLREDVAAEVTLDGMDQLVPALEERGRVLHSLAAATGGIASVGVVGMPRSGKTLFARDLARIVDGGTTVLDDPTGDALAGCARTIEVVADEEVLVRRAQGERAGMGPVEELMERRLPEWRAGRDAGATPTVVVDMSSPIEPRLC